MVDSERIQKTHTDRMSKMDEMAQQVQERMADATNALGAASAQIAATRIAIVGGGIAGLAAARTLARRNCRVTLFEAGDYVGGHVNTIDVDTAEGTWAIDTGFPLAATNLHVDVLGVCRDGVIDNIRKRALEVVSCALKR